MPGPILAHAPAPPLRRDVHLLGRLLGQVLAEEGGRSLLNLVEEVRRETKALRLSPDPQRQERLLRRLADLPLAQQEGLARAFTLYFLVVNTAEQVHRLRRWQAYRRRRIPQPGSPLAWEDEARRRGLEGEALQHALQGSSVEVVLTAHPTEARRRTVLQMQRRLAQDLLVLDRWPVGSVEHREARRRVKETIRALWHTRMVRRHTPSVLDEVEQGVEYLVFSVAPALPRVAAEWRHALRRRGVTFPGLLPLRVGSWMGGDRDGHPGVTAQVTAQTLARMEKAARSLYASWLEELMPQLAWRAEELTPRQRDILEGQVSPEDPSPLQTLAHSILRRLRAEPQEGGFSSSEELLAELHRLDKAWDPSGEHPLPDLERLVDAVRSMGLGLAALDVREHAARVRQAWEQVQRGQEADDGVAQEVVATLRAVRQAQRRHGPSCVRRYILSMTQEPDDLLAALSLLEREDLAGRVDLVPLFESLPSLSQAPGILAQVWSDPGYRRHLSARGNLQWVMLGYSDSGKDGGYLAASWALYRTQERLLQEAARHRVGIAFFHGRGGSLGRGGGPTLRAVAALPPGSVAQGVCFTVQGEMLAEQLLTPELAQRSLEQYLTAVALALLPRGPEEEVPAPADRAIMDRLAAWSEQAYRSLVEGNPDLVSFLEEATPLPVLDRFPMGSRPARRAATRSLADLRAIPWVFAWTQSRILFPAWYGVGTALETWRREEGEQGWETLRSLARRWPWLRATLDNLEMALAKADMGIGRLYASLARSQAQKLWEQLEEEYGRTVRLVLELRDHQVLLEEEPALRASILLRNPYVDPLHYLQVLALRACRSPHGSADPHLAELLLLTMQGVAQGLRNTG